jgi:hypothetical protein
MRDLHLPLGDFVDRSRPGASVDFGETCGDQAGERLKEGEGVLTLRLEL